MCTFFCPSLDTNRPFAIFDAKNVHLIKYEVHILRTSFCKRPVGSNRQPKECTLFCAVRPSLGQAARHRLVA